MANSGYISAVRFAKSTLAGTVLMTVVAAALTWHWDASVAGGISIGGGAGALGFAMLVRNAGTLTSMSKEEIPLRVYRWTFARMALYALALMAAYLSFPDRRNALLGAAVGLFISRIVMLATGVWVWRNRVAETKHDG